MTWLWTKLIPVAEAAYHLGDPLVPCNPQAGADGQLTDPCKWSQLLLLIDNVFQYLVIIAVPIATIAIVYAGIILITQPANEGKRTEAKDILWTAVLGLIAVLAAYLVVKTLLNTLTSDARYHLS